MKTTIDRAGRLVIPKEIRQKAGLLPGMPLEIRVEDGRIEIKPATLPVEFVRRGELLVAVPLVPVPALTPEMVEETRAALQAERLTDI